MPSSKLVYHGINYVFPTYKASGNDNVIATGQNINFPRGKYFSVNILAAAESGLTTGNFTATYADGSISEATVLVQSWWNGAPTGGDFIFPYHYTSNSINWNRSMIFEASASLDASKEMVSLTLPDVTGGSANAPKGGAITNRLHIFSLSLLPASSGKKQNATELEVQYARTTQKWITGSNKVQIVEVVVNNIGAGWIKKGSYVEVSISSPGLRTVHPGVIKRLRPGDQARVEVGVVNQAGVSAGSTGQATVILSGPTVKATHSFSATFGIEEYQPTYESIYTHESPSWYSGAKYGIFIHWGPYAVPGWGNSGSHESYAEWYAFHSARAIHSN